MEELAKVKRVIGKVIPDAPHEVWLVLDATVGQNGILQAREFQKAIGITGLILTKLDGTAKGGIALAIHRELNIPIRFLGVGEKLTDLVEFDPNQYIRDLLNIE
jgi:fused signal recognition particle receptor